MQRRGHRRRVLLGLIALAAAAGCGPAGEDPDAVLRRSEAAYAGASLCAGCHPNEFERWRGSHHDRAMEVASEATVLGDFGGAELAAGIERFRFTRRDGRFVIRTAGADGVEAEFEVTHTFGVAPLQQYLVALPGGRRQAVGAAWDARPAEAGGQRWFHLHAEAPPAPGDALHWTGMAGRWNAMCAECHSTNIAKGYDAAADSYATVWSELDVACEACHGPGAAHAAWAESGASGEDRPALAALRDPRRWEFASDGAAIAHRLPVRASDAEIEVCAPCHARRSTLAAASAPGRPFLDGYRPALLDEGLYHADGRIQDEVYVWGSFVQSKMYAAGVTCSDCHDPHALRIEEPDAVCGSCHRAEVFAARGHHHHEPASPGASCVACHMPAEIYMGVDARHDHSFRLPRPDLSASIGVPNACGDCHADHGVSWAAQAISGWRGGAPPDPHYGEALAAGRRGEPGADRRLAALAADGAAPAIARATALQLLGRIPGRELTAALARGLEDSEPLVRMAAAGAAESLPPSARPAALGPLLEDPARAVRSEAARVIASAPRKEAPAALAPALAEYRAAQAANADRSSAHVNLALLDQVAGELDAARRAYETGIRLESYFVPAYVNLADLHRGEGNDPEAERVLRVGLLEVPESADLHHSLGLLLVRTGRVEEALDSLGHARTLAPENARYAYVYAVALNGAGEPRYAISILEAAHEQHPGDAGLLLALATMARDAGDLARARAYAEKLLALRPEDPRIAELVQGLSAP